MKKRISELKLFNWNLWLSLCALALIPAVYQTVKTFLISENGQSGAFDIIGQMEWFDLINETLQAFLIVPLYSVLNRIFEKSKNEFADVADEQYSNAHKISFQNALSCCHLRGVNSSLCISHFCTKNANLSKILQDV